MENTAYLEWLQAEQFPGIDRVEIFGRKMHVYFERDARLSELVAGIDLLNTSGLRKFNTRISENGYVSYELEPHLQ